MKPLRSLFALVFAATLAATLAGSLAFAEPHPEKKTDAKPAKAACGCATGKDGKVCGVDKDCCCSGEKAKGKAPEKKPEAGAKKTDEKKSAKAGDKADAVCPPCEACKA